MSEESEFKFQRVEIMDTHGFCDDKSQRIERMFAFLSNLEIKVDLIVFCSEKSEEIKEIQSEREAQFQEIYLQLKKQLQTQDFWIKMECLQSPFRIILPGVQSKGSKDNQVLTLKDIEDRKKFLQAFKQWLSEIEPKNKEPSSANGMNFKQTSSSMPAHLNENRRVDYQQGLASFLESQDLTKTQKVQLQVYYQTFLSTFQSVRKVSTAWEKKKISTNSSNFEFSDFFSAIVTFNTLTISTISQLISSEEFKRSAESLLSLISQRENIEQILGGICHKIVQETDIQEAIFQSDKDPPSQCELFKRKCGELKNFYVKLDEDEKMRVCDYTIYLHRYNKNLKQMAHIDMNNVLSIILKDKEAFIRNTDVYFQKKIKPAIFSSYYQNKIEQSKKVQK